MLSLKYLLVLSVCGSLCSALESSSIEQRFDRVLLRRKRALLAPKGTALKFTVNVSKKLIALYPRGLNFVFEAAAYYPVPGTLDELFPKRKKPTAKPVIKPKIQIPPYNYNSVNYHNLWLNTTNGYHWETDGSEDSLVDGHQYIKDWNQDKRHWLIHRERRDLFNTFIGLSKVIGLDVRACLMRTICDVKKFLLPRGYSMIHDIIRLIFDFKPVDGLSGNYNEILNHDFESCDQKLKYDCPFSFLDWLLTSNKYKKL